MTDLHWLYVHGVQAGAFTLAIAAVVGAFAAHVRAQRKARARGAAASAALGSPITKVDAIPAGGSATLSGVLDAGSETFDVARSASVERAPERFVLRLEDGARIAIAGHARLVVGSFEAPLRARVVAGDRVIVRGHVKHVAKEEGEGYREASSSIRLEGRPSVEIVFDGAPRARASLAAFLVHAALGAALGGVGLFVLGWVAELGSPGDGTSLTFHALAAATPSRKDALRSLLDELERVSSLGGDDESRANLARASDVSLLLGDCAHAASIWLSLAEGARAEVVASSCGATIDGDAYLSVGAVDAASRAYEQARTATFKACSTHAAARRYALAASCIRDVTPGREPGRDPGSRDRAQAMGCIADALDVRAGRGAALEPLRAAARERAMCRVLLADLLEGEERLALFDDPAAAWAWRDAQAMDFAKGRVVSTAARLTEEVRGPFPEERYAFSVSSDAVLASDRWESNHRSDTPGCLLAALSKRPTPQAAYGYRTMLGGNLAQFYATLGDARSALDALRSIRDVPDAPPAVDYEWRRPSSTELQAVIDRLLRQPESGSRWIGGRSFDRDPSVWVVLDDLAAVRRSASRGRALGSAVVARPVERIQEALIRRETCVPLHMLQAFDLKR